MKLGFIAHNDLESIEKDAAFAAEQGFQGLEFNWWGGFKDVTEAHIKQTAKILQKHGVGCCMLGLWGFNHLSKDKAERKQALALLDRAIKFAGILGAEVLTTGAGEMPGEPLGVKVKEFAKVFGPILKKLEKAKLTPSFYPMHGNSFLSGLSAYEAVWEACPQVKIKLDPANWKHHGDDYLEALEKYGGRVGYIHIKEHLYRDGRLASQPAAGMGDIEWGKVFAFLYEHDYRGWLSVEPHGPKWGRGELRWRMLRLTKKYIQTYLD
ncbi:MAG: sugar phosphate isomerase/epimerase [Planctomycetota bacterium]|nr:sugar phosphate isomerase/epimerase [Planctomycetota bacterium]